jgi:hypothetical protein
MGNGVRASAFTIPFKATTSKMNSNMLLKKACFTKNKTWINLFLNLLFEYIINRDFVGYFFNESNNETSTKKRTAKISLCVSSVIAMSFFATMNAAAITAVPIITTGELLKRETNLLAATFIQKSK